jgi:hypothetical protein
MESSLSRDHSFKKRIAAAMTLPLLMVPPSILMFFLMILGVPGMASPRVLQGLTLIVQTLMFYPFAAITIMVLVAYQAFISKKPSHRFAWGLVWLLYAVLTAACITLIWGIRLVVTG